MKPKLLAVAILPVGLVVGGVLVLAARARPRAPDVVAEQWVAPAPVPTATVEAEHEPRPEKSLADRVDPAPLPDPRPAPREVPKTVEVRKPGFVAFQSPRVIERPRPRCPPSIVPSEPYLREGRCPPRSRDTPLVLSFDGAPVEYLADQAHAFDIDGSKSQVTDWPTARSPWLALDRDGDGRIADGSELFGSMTVLSSGERAPDGFAALRELDTDGDGRITPADPGFARLLVWSDRDGDRRSSPDELAPASAYGLLSIDLDYAVDPRCDARENCEVERASFRYRDAAGVVRTGAVIDVHLPSQRVGAVPSSI